MPKPSYHLTRRLIFIVTMIWIVLMLGLLVSTILTVQWWQLAVGQNLLNVAAWLTTLTLVITVLGIWSMAYLIRRVTRPIEDLATAVQDGATSSKIDTWCDNPQVETRRIAREFRTRMTQLEAHEETLRQFQDVQATLVQLIGMMRPPILGTRQRERLMLEIIDFMQKNFGYSHVSIYQFDSENQALHRLAPATNQNQDNREVSQPDSTSTSSVNVTPDDERMTGDALSLNAAREVIVQAIRTAKLSQAQASLSVDAAASADHEACQPIGVGGKVMGVVYVQYPAGFPFEASNELILSLVSQQLAPDFLPNSTSPDNDTQAQVEQQQLIAEIGDKLRQAPDIDTLMRITVNELSRTLKPARTFIKLDSAVKLESETSKP